MEISIIFISKWFQFLLTLRGKVSSFSYPLKKIPLSNIYFMRTKLILITKITWATRGEEHKGENKYHW